MLDLQSLGEARVFDTEGQSHRLATAWSHQTAVLIFLRHFG